METLPLGGFCGSALSAIMAAASQHFLSLAEDGTVLAFLPPDIPLLGRTREDVLGKRLDVLFRANYVRVFDGKDSWNEIVYLEGMDGKPRPFGVRRLPADQEPFPALAPEAREHLLINELLIYGALEDLHERTLAEHAQELEAVNEKLKRQTHQLRKALEILESRNRQMIKELNLAVELQKALLPKSYPPTPSAAFTHRYIPLAMVGGDFFALSSMDKDRVGILIADVSGHGVAPAFITAMIRSLFDYLHPRESSPAEVIRRINEEFSKIVNTDHFVTAFYGIFDFEAMSCTYCGAGHPPQLIVHSSGGVTRLSSEDPIIGMSDDCEYHDRSVALSGGDLLCFYTDGVQEARNSKDEMFGVQGIEETVIRYRNSDLESVADALITGVIQFMRDPVFEDDITVVLGQVIESL